MKVTKAIKEWIKKCPIKGKIYFYTTKEKAIDTINNKNPVVLLYVKKEKILDKTKRVHGINCFCIECQKIRRLLRDKEKSGEIYLSGTESDKRKIRSEN